MDRGLFDVSGNPTAAHNFVSTDLGQHGVVLKLGLPQRGGVASNDDQLGLSGAKAARLLGPKTSRTKKGIAYDFRVLL